MAQDTLLGFPAHTLPFRCGKSPALSTASIRSSDRTVWSFLKFFQFLVR